MESWKWQRLSYQVPSPFDQMCRIAREIEWLIDGMEGSIQKLIREEEKLDMITFSRARSKLQRVIGLCLSLARPDESFKTLGNLEKWLNDVETVKLIRYSDSREVITPFYVSIFSTFLDSCIYDPLVQLKDQIKLDGEENITRFKRRFVSELRKRTGMFIAPIVGEKR